jgi:hypothetical protein
LSGIGSHLIPVQSFDIVECWRVVVARWWLVGVGVLLGAALGVVLLHGRVNTYRASAQLYVGEGSEVDLPATLAEASAYVTSVAATRAAARATGIDPGALRQSVSTMLDVGPGASRLGSAGSALIEVSVTGSNAHKVAQAADVLARNTAVVLSTYARRALRLSSSNLAVVSAELRDMRARLKVDESVLQQLAYDPRSTTTQRLVEIKTFARQVAEESKQRTLLQQETLAARLQMVFEQGFELPRLARPAESVSRGGPSRAAGVLVGALIGLLLGVLAALAVAASRPPPSEPIHA